MLLPSYFLFTRCPGNWLCGFANVCLRDRPRASIAIEQHQQLIHELQENLEQVTRDRSALEAKLAEMSSHKSEVLVLQSEITKLQVNHARESPS